MTPLYHRTIRFAPAYRLLLLLLLTTTFTAQAQIIRYVSSTGSNASPTSATSWATSTTDLQGAINASAANDQVWMAAGLYKPTSTTARTVSFAMKAGVAIYGGFVGTETTLAGRVLTFPSGTTLSGDIGTPGSTTDNSYHVFRNSTGLTSSAILDGFVIRDGNANGPLFADTKGGGMYNASTFGTTCSPQLRNCWFINNTASNYGGAMLNDGSNSGTCSPLLVNCLFQDNSATFSGGAIRNEGNNSGTCSPVLVNCSFQRNQSPFGGVMFNLGSGGTSSPVLTNCSFQRNTATNGGILYNDGSSGGASNPVLTNCVVWGNGGVSTFVNTVGASVTVSYSLFESTITGYTNGPGNLTATTSPFVSATSTQLSPCSPAINAGSPATTTATVGLTDLAGNPRFVNNAGTPTALLDMGAYEFQDSQAVPLTPPNGSSFTVCNGSENELVASSTDFSLHLSGASSADFPLFDASFGPSLTATAINGPITFLGQLTDTNQGCSPYPAGTFSGKIALIRRGTCSFTTKVKNAQDAGAIGVLIFNDSTIPLGLAGTDETITIPAAEVSQADGEAIVGAVAVGEVIAKSRLISYSWAPGTGLSTTTGRAVTANLTQTTAYTVTASIPGVCTSQTVITVTVTPFPSLTLTASPGLPLTSGQSTTLTVTPGQSITLTVSGATSYTWSNGQTTNTLIIPSASTSTYALTSLLGICQRTTSVIINPPVCGSVIYVTQSGAGSQNGSSWANAVPGSGLQMAINTAATCGTQAAVWVANGLYKPALAPGNSPTDRTVSFAMQNGVAIYGGFLGSETTLSQRPVINLTAPSGTTLSGEIGNPASTSDNSYHVISNASSLSLTTTAILDGFILTGGNANGTFANGLGGGVFNTGSGLGNRCSPTIRNCLFVNNSAREGGAMYNTGSQRGSSSPTLTNCSFQSNTATSSGGAMYNTGGGSGSSSPVLTNCSFRNNLASDGGSIYNDGQSSGISSPVLTNCSFQSNTATSNGGAMYNYGASGNSSPVLTNCVLFGNGGGNTFVNSGTASVSANYSLFDNTAVNYTATNSLTVTTSPFASTTSVVLAACSPAVDAGLNSASGLSGITTDLLGQARFFNNGRVDMGAFEFQGSTTLTVSASPSLTITRGQTLTLTASGGSDLLAPSYIWTGGSTGATFPVSPTATTAYSVTSLIGACTPTGSTSLTVIVTVNVPLCYSVIYVSQAGAGLQNGSSWANAYPGPLLQTAITAAASCSAQVWVAAGLYKPTSTTTRTASFSIASGVQVYGGFVGTETALSQRPAGQPITTLSGEIGNTATTADNSYHVVRFFRAGAQTRLDGFMITGGNANDPAYPDNCGGGIYNNGTGTGNSSNPTLVNCLFLSNAARSGGGIYNDGNSAGISNPALTNCSFQNNSASSGGAIYNIGANSSIGPVLTNCSFQSNSASVGGAAMRNLSSSPTLTNCVFFDNGGTNTFFNSSASVTAAYSLLDNTATGYTATNSLKVTISPFASTTSTLLAATSPAINAGDPATTSATSGTTDLAGNPRFVNTIVDMGAYEFQQILEVFSLKNGLWNDASLWSVGRLPLATERVRLKHAVTMPTNFTGLSGTLIYNPNSRLIYEAGGRLQIGQ